MTFMFKPWWRDGRVTHEALLAGFAAAGAQGEIANATVARRLNARGYDGWVALETRGRDDLDPVSAVDKELPLLKSCFCG